MDCDNYKYVYVLNLDPDSNIKRKWKTLRPNIKRSSSLEQPF